MTWRGVDKVNSLNNGRGALERAAVSGREHAGKHEVVAFGDTEH